jgi:hypothetical protein
MQQEGVGGDGLLEGVQGEVGAQAVAVWQLVGQIAEPLLVLALMFAWLTPLVPMSWLLHQVECHVLPGVL